jgi:hypothetical protein
MNHVVAYRLLASELNEHRALPFSELQQLIGKESTRCVRGEDGVEYDLTVAVRLQSGVCGDIAIAASIGESAWGGPHDTLDDAVIVSSPEGT